MGRRVECTPGWSTAVLVAAIAVLSTTVINADAPAWEVPRISPTHGGGALLDEPPVRTAEEIAQFEAYLEMKYELRRALFQLPQASETRVVQGVSTLTSIGAAMGDLRAPDDFVFFRNTVMDDTFTNNSTSSTNEPSLGVTCGEVLYVGNWYASLSTDYGQNYTFIDPATFFPSANGGFCCDQVAYYEPSRGVMFWYLQYVADANGNTVRLAVTDDPANIATRVWSYSLTPQLFGYDTGVWFDFPDLAVSNNYLYITTNFGNESGAIVMRLDLDDLASANPVTVESFTSDLPNMRATLGATGTMYVGTQVDTDTLRIYTWPEGAASPTSVDRDVDQYFTGSSAPSPDRTDWVARDFNDILAAWTAKGIVGFMWGSAQGGGFTWPNVRWARFNTGGLGLFDQGQVWNADYAYAYPAVHPNDNQDIGGLMAVGGGGTIVPWPSALAWISDDVNGDILAPLENRVVSEGDDGPNSNRWGDYYTSRRQDPYGDTWVGGAHVLRGGGGNASAEPHFVWFGREADQPSGPEITCPGDTVVECSATGGTPATDSQLDDFFDDVSATDACDDPTITDNAPGFFPLGDTTVTFTAENGNGLTGSCSDTVTVEDTAPPMIACPAGMTIECDQPTDPSNTGVATASDVCDPTLMIGFSDVVTPGACPQESTISRTWTATDGSGNFASCLQTIEVVDTTPPVLSVELTPNVLWPPNHKFWTVMADITVTDNCDGDPNVTLISITSNESDNANGDGNTNNDIRGADVGTDDREFQLRAERQGGGDGRIYTITYDAVDGCGNRTETSAEARVPHDQSGHAFAWIGIATNGTGLDPHTTQWSLLVPSSAEFDALSIDTARAYVGNYTGVQVPVDVAVVDIQQDGLLDLVLVYDAERTRDLQSLSNRSLGLHYQSSDGMDYAIPDVLELIAPVQEPPLEEASGDERIRLTTSNIVADPQ